MYATDPCGLLILTQSLAFIYELVPLLRPNLFPSILTAATAATAGFANANERA
jgi:hypothetical protein